MPYPNLRTFSWQQIIPQWDWLAMKGRPEMKDYLHGLAHQQLAAKLAETSVATFVINEPGETNNPLNQTAAVIRCTVAVGSKDDASSLALELAEAEDRGFQAALDALAENLEAVAPRLGPSAYARAALDRLVHIVAEVRKHRPTADWRPMRSQPCDGSWLEFLFHNGSIHTAPVLQLPRPLELAFSASQGADAGTVAADRLDAIGWRYRGRPSVEFR